MPYATTFSHSPEVQILLASFPLLALGLLAPTVAAFQIAIKRMSWTFVTLLIALAAAFSGGLFELANVLLCENMGMHQLLPGLLVAQGVALAIFTAFKFWFLYHRTQQRGLCEKRPLALPGADPNGPATPPPRSGSYKAWGLAGRAIRPVVWVTIIATAVVDSVWRIGFDRSVSGFIKVYLASNILQLVMLAFFALKLLASTAQSKPRFQIRTYLSLSPLVTALTLAIAVQILSLPSHLIGFTETPLGRLLLLLEMYIFVLEATLLDLKRPRRDSVETIDSFRGRSTTPDAGDKAGVAPALSRSPIGRARQAARTSFADFRRSFSSSVYSTRIIASSFISDDSAEREQDLASGQIVVRNSSPLPSWLPVVRGDPQSQRNGSDERVNLAFAVARAAGTERQQESLLTMGASSFPESVNDEDRSMLEGATRARSRARAEEGENARIVFAATPKPGGAVGADDYASERRALRPVLTIATTNLPSFTSRSEPTGPPTAPPTFALPPLPLSGPLALSRSNTTESSAFSIDSDPRFHITSPTTASPPTAVSSKIPDLLIQGTRSAVTGSDASGMSTLGSASGENSLQDAPDGFPQPPAIVEPAKTSALSRGSSMRTKDGSEFELVSPSRSPLAPALAGELQGGRGLDITSLIVEIGSPASLKAAVARPSQLASTASRPTFPVPTAAKFPFARYHARPTFVLADPGRSLPNHPPLAGQQPRPWPPPATTTAPPHSPSVYSSALPPRQSALAAAAARIRADQATGPPLIGFPPGDTPPLRLHQLESVFTSSPSHVPVLRAKTFKERQQQAADDADADGDAEADTPNSSGTSEDRGAEEVQTPDTSPFSPDDSPFAVAAAGGGGEEFGADDDAMEVLGHYDASRPFERPRKAPEVEDVKGGERRKKSRKGRKEVEGSSAGIGVAVSSDQAIVRSARELLETERGS
ncbi:hypothetical protein JCM5296_005877 [Sporobolomyces johnsonii]